MTATPEWNSEHVTELRKFLATPTGRRLFEVLQMDAPGYPKEAYQQDSPRVIASAIREGYERCLSTFVALSVPIEAQTAEPVSYPDPDGPPELWSDVDVKTLATMRGE
jgi:hypothetical protein